MRYHAKSLQETCVDVLSKFQSNNKGDPISIPDGKCFKYVLKRPTGIVQPRMDICFCSQCRKRERDAEVYVVTKGSVFKSPLLYNVCVFDSKPISNTSPKKEGNKRMSDNNNNNSEDSDDDEEKKTIHKLKKVRSIHREEDGVNDSDEERNMFDMMYNE